MKLPELRAHARELGFTPQEQVRWLAPAELARTALQVAVASAFSQVADNRELQRSFPAQKLELKPDADGGLWLDFVADLGDGFDPTYTVARLLSAPSLEVRTPAGGSAVLPRGRALVLGGDEVYPTASRAAYEDRLKGPYRMALPEGDPSIGREQPRLLALPGNHDWYDGLTAFLRTFTQHRTIGGRRTIQDRSYFAVKLPGKWWLAGLDSQLGTEIDDPQLDYFRTNLTERLKPGDGVVVCSASPSWVHTPGEPDAWDTLQFFENTVVTTRRDRETDLPEPTGAQVRLWITGDMHHYARYEERSVDDDHPRQLVTCGLGGAFLLGTDRLPEQLTLPPKESRAVPADGVRRRYELDGRWPPDKESRRLPRALLAGPPRGLPWRNPGFWTVAGIVQAVMFAVLGGMLGLMLDAPPTVALRTATVRQALDIGGQVAFWVVVVVLLRSLYPLVRRRRPRPPSDFATLFLLQTATAVGALAVVVWAVRTIDLPRWFPGGRQLPDYLMYGVATGLVALAAGLAGCYLVAIVLLVSRGRLMGEWRWSALALEEYKGFVRLRIDPSGRLTLYPVVVDEVCHDWELDTAGRGRPPVAVPAQEPVPYLAEPPVVVERQP